MSVIAGEIKFYYTGGSSNQTPGNSLGGTGSTYALTVGINNLFDNVLASEASAGDVEYRAIDIININASSEALYNAKCWITVSGLYIGVALWIDTSGTAVASPSNESTPPAGASFAGYASEGAALVLSSELTYPERVRLWIRRTITASATAQTNVGFTLTVKGETT